MPLPFWPYELPQRLLQDGYSYSFADGRLKTAMDQGPPRVRKRFSSAVRPFNGRFLGTEDDMRRLERFWHEDIGGGSLPFIMPDQTADDLPLANEDLLILCNEDDAILLNSGYWTVMFADGPPEKAVVSGNYQISLSLVVLP